MVMSMEVTQTYDKFCGTQNVIIKGKFYRTFISKNAHEYHTTTKTKQTKKHAYYKLIIME
jgi:hypothetical protein